jgi:hypothetical protein
MKLDLIDYKTRTLIAVKAFWDARELARKKQIEAGKTDQGERAGVTAGNNMNGFRSMIIDVIRANGLDKAEVMFQKKVITLPGFFRPTKQWDMLVMCKNQLIAALEFKSQVGPSFGNNCNNRAEEAIGSAHDFWVAYREGAFGNDAGKPFLGWLILLEDAQGSRVPVHEVSPHFPVFKEFVDASYSERYNILCRKLVQEQLYSAASVVLSPRTSAQGKYSELSPLTGIKTFITRLAGHVAGEAARLE